MFSALNATTINLGAQFITIIMMAIHHCPPSLLDCPTTASSHCSIFFRPQSAVVTALLLTGAIRPKMVWDSTALRPPHANLTGAIVHKWSGTALPFDQHTTCQSQCYCLKQGGQMLATGRTVQKPLLQQAPRPVPSEAGGSTASEPVVHMHVEPEEVLLESW